MDKLDKFISQEYVYMFTDLELIIKDCDEFDQDLDIRLCIDLDDDTGIGSWIFRTGDASYDWRHSRYCAASSVTWDTNPKHLLDQLIGDL